MNILDSFLTKNDVFGPLCSERPPRTYVEGLDGYPLFRFVSLIAEKRTGLTWLVCPTEETARQAYSNAAYSLSKGCQVPVLMLPADGRVLYSGWEGTSKEYEQLRILGQVATIGKALVITSLRTFCLPLPSKRDIAASQLRLKVNSTMDTMQVASFLGDAGYFRSASTSMPGEFSVRGEVMDIFPYGEEMPVRVYLDWDRIQSISVFDPISQQVKKSLGHLDINVVSPSAEHVTTACAIKDYIGKDDFFAFMGSNRLDSSFKSLQLEAKTLYRRAYQENHEAPRPDEVILDWNTFMSGCSKCLLIPDISGENPGAFRFGMEGPRSYFGNFTLLKEELKGLIGDGWTVKVMAGSAPQKKRMEQMLDEFPDVEVVQGSISAGFSIPSRKYIVLCESEIFGRRKQVVKTLQHTQSAVLDSFVELHEGDYVVHVNYGIGIFLKIDRVRERDYIKIKFADNESLYVPIEQSNLIQRYIGSNGEAPKLDKLGSGSWENKKAKARKSAEDLAGYLVKLYARRKNSIGFAFDKDNDWQMKFEAEFEYEETDDQLSCIADVKEDMESPVVMDRLICGDVGYGKTEIAFRAVFKAVMSGKQVAFLAPTTILAEQHFRNFKERLHEFPVRVGLLSRMVPAKEQKKVIGDVSTGNVDVLFGTQRIIQKDIVFKDLGLLVVDEEQRFGVKDKEKIKEMKNSIDCLSLSATPIPRTLYMSLLKIRDMSLLTTPPVLRKPIRTVVERFDLDEVEKAIRFEIARHGQVFYLHNRIETLEETATMLRSRMPDVIVETANGQMDSASLEDVMRRFLYEGVQVLVSTTIIENGIDIPNVNTIIIDRADMYGVSQLYQLKGRVGRSDREAWAYLFYPSDHVLSEIAIKRLQIISDHTDLGSGFKVAMKDMEIRGAGNLLGREQSGFMSAVGLDMYMRLLDEEIEKISSSGKKERETEVFLELDYSGYIPDSYIPDSVMKFEIYKKIASIRQDQDLQKLTAELKDRFGSIPEEVSNLLYISELKVICRKLDICHIKERNGEITIEFAYVAGISVDKVLNMIKTGNGNIILDPHRLNIMKMKTSAVSLKDKALFILERLQRLLP